MIVVPAVCAVQTAAQRRGAITDGVGCAAIGASAIKHANADSAQITVNSMTSRGAPSALRAAEGG